VPSTSSSRRRAASVLVLSVAVTAASLTPGLGGGERTAQASAVPPPAGWVAHLNEMRADYGAGPVTVDATLSSAAQQHALYMAEHRALTREEVPGRARYTVAGAAAARHSLLAGPAGNGEDSPAEFVDLWARGAYSALALLHPEVARIGYGQAQVGSADYAALDVRSARAVRAGAAWPRTWPSARRPVVLTTYSGAESPDPVSRCGTRPQAGWGLPLLVSYGPGARPTGATASLTVDGRTVGVCVVAAAGNPDGEAVARLDEAHSIVVVPREPLRVGGSYTGSVSSSRGRVPIRFSVAADAAAGPTAGAPSAAPSAWQRLPGAAREIAVGGEGTAWALGRTAVAGGFSVHRWNGRGWATVPGGAVRLDVDGAGQAWIVNSAGAVYRRTGTGWQRLPGAAREVGVGADGTAWVLGRTAVGGGFTIHRWNGRGWATVPGGAVRLDVDGAGQAWIVNSAGAVYRRTGTGWQRLPGAAREVGVGADGTAWVLGRTAVGGGSTIHRWNGRGWATVPGGAVAIDVDGTGQAWIVNSAGALYRRTGSA